MKNAYQLLLVPMLCMLTGFGVAKQETQHTIIVSNLENINGALYIGWYNQPATFSINEQAIYREKVMVNKQEQVTVVFKNIPPGRYAIAVFLDENDNYKLDRNFLGVPTEKYGFSNNVLPALRAATFEESVFEVGRQETIVNIRLK